MSTNYPSQNNDHYSVSGPFLVLERDSRKK